MSSATEISQCPVCDAKQRALWVEFPQLAFCKCAGCGAVYKSREQPALLAGDFYEKGYFSGRKSGREKRFEHRVRKAQRWLSDALAFAPGAKTLLDVGCSMGYVLEGGRRLGLTSSGVDVSNYAAEHCRSLGFDAKVGTVDQMPFDAASFDVVVMKHVLEHSFTPVQAMNEVRRLLKPGGVVLIAVPDLSYWKGSLWRRRGRYFRPDELGGQHHVYFDQPALKRVLDRTGFTVLAEHKAVRRHQGPLEAVRFAGLWAWQAAAKTLRLRRELYVLARS